jgi:hypothetical protein
MLGLSWQYRCAKHSIIRSIFCASPGRRKLHRNCLQRLKYNSRHYLSTENFKTTESFYSSSRIRIGYKQANPNQIGKLRNITKDKKEEEKMRNVTTVGEMTQNEVK